MIALHRIPVTILFSNFFLLSFSQEWNDDEKKLFHTACMQEAKVNMTESASVFYCGCVVDQLVNSFPDGAFDTLITTDAVERITDSCIIQAENKYGDLTYKATWDEDSKNAFHKSCKETLKNVSQYDQDEYCTCVLSKIVINYPDPQFLRRISEEEIKSLSEGCR